MNSHTFFLFSLIAGLFISTNPFAIDVFTKILAAHKGRNESATKRTLRAFIYILMIWTMLSAIGILFYLSLISTSLKSAQYLSIALAGIGVIVGLFEIKKYYWPKVISEKRTARIHRALVKESSLVSIIKLSLETLFENVGSYILPVLLFAVLMTFSKVSRIYYIPVFSVAVLFSLIKLLILSGTGIRMSAILEWNQNRKELFRICMGIGCILLSWLVLLVVSDVIGFN